MTLPARTATTAIAISAAIAAATTTARTASATAGLTAALCSRTSLVYGNRATAEIAAVQCRDGCARLCAVGHLDKTEAAKPSAELIADQIYFTNRSILSKSLSQVVFTSTKREISHVDVQALVRPFGNVNLHLGPYHNNQTRRERHSKQVSVGSSGVELGRSKCTPVLYPVSLRACPSSEDIRSQLRKH